MCVVGAGAIFTDASAGAGNYVWQKFFDLMDVYNCAKGHLPKCIFNHFMEGGLIPPPPSIPDCTRKPNINRVKLLRSEYETQLKNNGLNFDPNILRKRKWMISYAGLK